MAFETLDNHYANRISSGDDKMSLCQKREKEILVHIILKEYAKAAEELNNLNKEFPNFGDYGKFMNYPLSDKIRKEYPPFQKALANLKRNPYPNVNEYIKF